MIELKLEDLQILNEEPVIFKVGPKKKKIVLKMLSIGKYYDKFLPQFMVLLDLIKQVQPDFFFPDKEEKNQLKKMLLFLRQIISFKVIRKQIIKILKIGFEVQASKSYLEKYLTPVQLIEILYLIYKFNIAGFKKKLQELSEKIGITKPQSQTFTGYWSPGDGYVGIGERERLKPRF